MAPVDSALVEALRTDEGLSSLVHGLALSERFHFWMIVCDTPRVASAVLAILAEDVAAEREGPVRIIRLNPYAALTDPLSPMPFETLVDEVLAKLVSPAEADRSPEVLVAVDATGALAQDDAAWAELFQRMNEQRNVIAASMKGQLLLLLPPRLEPVFAHSAPDFWSIRSRAVVVRGPVEDLDLRGIESLLAPWPMIFTTPSTDDIAEIEAGLASARATLEENPDDIAATFALMVWLTRLTKHHMAEKKIDQAHAALMEDVLLARRLVVAGATDPWAERTLSNALDALGLVTLARGIPDDAIEIYLESLQYRRHLAESTKDADNRHDLAMTLHHLGEALEKANQPERALETYQEEAALMRQLVEQQPDRREWVGYFAILLVGTSRMRMDLGQLDAALEPIPESLTILRRLAADDPDDTTTRYYLATCLAQRGRVFQSRAELDLALESYRESIENLRGLLQRDSKEDGWRHALAVVLGWMGDVFTARGEPDRAAACYDESAQLQRELDTRAA